MLIIACILIIDIFAEKNEIEYTKRVKHFLALNFFLNKSINI